MGHGPKLDKAIEHKTEASEALDKEIKRVRATLKNGLEEGKTFISNNSNGIVLAKETNAPA